MRAAEDEDAGRGKSGVQEKKRQVLGSHLVVGSGGEGVRRSV